MGRKRGGARAKGKMKTQRWPWKRSRKVTQKYTPMKPQEDAEERKKVLEDPIKHYKIREDELPKVYHPAEDMAYRNPPFLIVFVIIIVLIAIFLMAL